MSATIIDGKAYAEGLRARIAGAVRTLAGQGVTPGLAVVIVGEDPASQLYVKNKARQTVEVGMRSFEHKLPTSTGEAELLDLAGTSSSFHRSAEKSKASFGSSSTSSRSVFDIISLPNISSPPFQ